MTKKKKWLRVLQIMTAEQKRQIMIHLAEAEDSGERLQLEVLTQTRERIQRYIDRGEMERDANGHLRVTQAYLDAQVDETEPDQIETKVDASDPRTDQW
ncbi:MAG: hypothetical protein WBC04_17730 [Candidatus Acidiferrales bacterium]